MDKRYEAIVLFGPPGVGKGTQGKLLSEGEGYFHFSSGEMFRNLDLTTDLGRKVKALIDEGNYVPDQETIALAHETLDRHVAEGRYNPATSYLLLDGIPRTGPQVGMIRRFIDLKQVLQLYADEETLIARLRGRAEQENRVDDAKIEVIQNRFRIYREKTVPTIAHYGFNIIYQVDGNPPIQEVHQNILRLILRK